MVSTVVNLAEMAMCSADPPWLDGPYAHPAILCVILVFNFWEAAQKNRKTVPRFLIWDSTNLRAASSPYINFNIAATQNQAARWILGCAQKLFLGPSKNWLWEDLNTRTEKLNTRLEI